MSLSQHLTIEQVISRAKRPPNKEILLLHGNSTVWSCNISLATQLQHEVCVSCKKNCHTNCANPSRDQINGLINLYHSGQLTKAAQACRQLLQTYPQSLIQSVLKPSSESLSAADAIP